ncbi:MAG TPA: SRPBCC family protein [Puia sp.]|nr:SRPBCC family protein [Puia sp.]
MENKKSSTQDRELLITRQLDAPIDLVWEAWTSPEHIANWWGPNGFTNTITKMDLRPGGEWDLIMHGPDGTDYKNKSIFKEVILHKKIVYEHVTGPKFVATITFEERGDQTYITWHMLFETAEEFIRTVKTFKADVGLRQNVEKLSAYLAGMKSR